MAQPLRTVRAIELDREIVEIGARAKLEALENAKAELLERYPFLRNGHSHMPVSNGLLDDINDFKSEYHVRKQRRPNKVYSETFKNACIAKVKAGDVVTDVAKSEDVSAATLRTWCVNAGVEITKLEWPERVRRMQAGKRGEPLVLPPPPNKGHAKVRKTALQSGKKRKLGGAAAKAVDKSRMRALQILAAMPDEGSTHLPDLAKAAKMTVTNATWHLIQGTKAGRIARTGKGMYEKTAKGRLYEQEEATE